jgi:hypothetical protein
MNYNKLCFLLHNYSLEFTLQLLISNIFGELPFISSTLEVWNKKEAGFYITNTIDANFLK